MYKPTVAIIVTTVHRDDLVIKTINSIIDNWQENYHLIVVDQNKEDSIEKTMFYRAVSSQFHKQEEQRIEVLRVPYNCGLSYARNAGVKRAKELNIPYTVISADSLGFTKSTQKINSIIPYLKRYDLIGMDIKDRIKWEAKMTLVEGKFFELDFIDSRCKKCSSAKLIIWNVDICRNFFITKTDTLIECPWDENLKAREHEDFFHQYSKKYKVGYTNWCRTDYLATGLKHDNPIYNNLRTVNMNEGLKLLKQKYNISGWVEYKNLENVHKR